MNARTFTDDHTGKRYTRVSAPAARRAFLEGRDVVLCPVNLYPFGPWRPCFFINLYSDSNAWEVREYGPQRVWDLYVNECTALNCTNSETGRYLAYYLQA